ncbi:MAG: hypothetical protein HYY61_03715 [Deltaproteobacteria bacterium]|nr:hypothetical protein [Deltaproteobacteria bacterium]
MEEKKLKLIYWGVFAFTFVGVIVAYALFGPTTMKKGDLMSYLEQINPMVQQTAQTLTSMNTVLSQPHSQRDPAAANIGRTKDLFASFYKQMAGIKAPAAISDIHAEFVDSMKNYAQGFALYEQALKENNNPKMQQATALLEQGSLKLNEASQKITKIEAK